MTADSFTGRVALVTGAASGIGAACARWLDRQGIAQLWLTDIDAEGLAALDLSCRSERCVGDVADEAFWNGIEAELTRLDHAVINAGIALGDPIVDQSFADWRRVHSVNLDGAFLALRASLRAMKRSGTGKSVVVTSSISGVKPLPGASAYGSTKAAVAHLARVAAAEHAADGIRVNAIAPGKVDTPIWFKTPYFDAMVEELGSREAAVAAIEAQGTPLGKAPDGDGIAAQIGFLLSDAAWNITGTVLVSDGGFSL